MIGRMSSRRASFNTSQYEVLLNGVKEEIRHVLDSEMAKGDGHLTPQQMYKAVKRYETYVARNKRLDGKGTSTSASQQKTTGQSSGYKPRFHKTTAFIATTGGPDDEADHPQGPLAHFLKKAISYKNVTLFFFYIWCCIFFSTYNISSYYTQF